MLLLISWRNIWRNKKRSLVILVAIAAGLLGGIFTSALMLGMLDQRFSTAIEQHISHIQIHDPEFITYNMPEYLIDDWEKVQKMLNEDEQVLSFSTRTIANGMLLSAHLSRGVEIKGVDPEAESSTTGLDKNIVDGRYFEDGMRNPVLIGRSLAEKTRLQTGSRLVLTFQDENSELVSAAFRVAGIYQTANTGSDENNVFVLRRQLDEYLSDRTMVHEFALIIDDLKNIDYIAGRYSERFPHLSVRTWADISSELSYLQQMSGLMLVIILGIILFALAFGLVNTMLMSVYERIRELGMLMAVGMNKKRVFGMIMTETILLTFSGAVSGIILALLTISYTGKKGIDLSVVGGDSMNVYGFPSMVYPQLDTNSLLSLIVLVSLTAIATSVFPALKAIRLLPAEAVRQE